MQIFKGGKLNIGFPKFDPEKFAGRELSLPMRILVWILVVVLMLVIFLEGIILIITHGPSPRAAEQYKRFMETPMSSSVQSEEKP